MVIEHKTRKIHVCDVCGANSLENENFEASFFDIKVGHFYEEPSFGDGAEYESKLWTVIHNNDPKVKSNYEIWDELREIAQNSEILMCHDCYLDFDNENNYISQFDKQLRENRARILLKFWRSKKVLPYVTDEEAQIKLHVDKLNKEIAELKENIKSNVSRGVNFDSYLDQLIAKKLTLDKVQK